MHTWPLNELGPAVFNPLVTYVLHYAFVALASSGIASTPAGVGHGVPTRSYLAYFFDMGSERLLDPEPLDSSPL